MITRDRALAILQQCTGDTIWPISVCQEQRIPDAWVKELSDAFESDFQRDHQTIYLDEQRTNQFHGIRDVDLAMKTGVILGVDVERLESQSFSRPSLVAAIKDAVMEG